METHHWATLEEFKRLGLKTVEIIGVRDHPQADRLWILKVRTGNEEFEIVAGIKIQYPEPSSLLGRTIILASNLQPIQIRGVESKGMLLAASNGSTLALLTTDRPVPPGTPVN